MPEKFPFAKRTDWPLSANEISQSLDRFIAAKVDVINLTESNPTRCKFSYPQKAILGSLNKKENLAYQPSACGMMATREAISRYYKDKGYQVSPERIVLTSSTSEGYSFVFRLLANFKESVFFPCPSYPLFSFLVDINDVVMKYYQLVYDGAWRVDFDSLVEMIDHKTKAIVTVNPNNPTGSFIKKDELSRFNEIALKHNLALVSDEVFADFDLMEDDTRVSLVNNDQALTFVLGGVSKTLALPQMKLSWIIVSGPEEKAKEALARLEVIADTFLSVSTPVQNALDTWFKQRKRIQEQIRSRLKENLKTLHDVFRKKEICEVLRTEGGWYAVLRVTDLFSEEELVLKLLKEDHVFVHPGYFFEFSEGSFLVLSLLPEKKRFKEGAERIFRRLEALS